MLQLVLMPLGSHCVPLSRVWPQIPNLSRDTYILTDTRGSWYPQAQHGLSTPKGGNGDGAPPTVFQTLPKF